MDKPLVAITGASSGIGAATAQLFANQGYPLLLMARRIDRLKALDLADTVYARVDVTQADQIADAIKQAEAEYGPVDCLINNAGVMLLGDASVQDPAEWQQMMNVNVMGVLNGIHCVLKGMIERKSGTIISVSSIAGRKTFPNHAAYCATKFAVHALMENIREEVSGHSIRCVTIAPGAVETELLSHTTSDEIKSGYEDWKTDMGGVITPENIADTISFAYNQPQNVCIREIVIAATRQAP